MSSQRRYYGTEQYIATHWPRFAALYGVMIGSLLLIGAGLVTGWYALVPFALVALLLSFYLTLTQLWTAHKLGDRDGLLPAEALYALSQAAPDARIACVDLGRRDLAVALARHLRTGHVTVIDVYNPESNPDAALRRLRNRATSVPPDPRLSWIDGSYGLLPLPDGRTDFIFLDRILGEIAQPTERLLLLAEAFRVLKPEGSILVAEPVRTSTNLMAWAPKAISLKTAEDWKARLIAAGFEPQAEQDLDGLLTCLVATRPAAKTNQQLALKLEFV